MNDKKFNKIFSTVLMTLMVVVIAITTAFKLQDPQARVVMLLIAAFGSVMGVASTVLSANGILWTFFFGILDVTFCTIVAADNGLWGNFALHLFFFLFRPLYPFQHYSIFCQCPRFRNHHQSHEKDQYI